MKHKIYTYIPKNIKASGYREKNNTFVILKGSFAVDDTELHPSFFKRRNNIAKRQELIGTGKLKKVAHLYQFTEDVEFHSPSLAANVISGRQSDGLKDFGIKDEMPPYLSDLL